MTDRLKTFEDLAESARSEFPPEIDVTAAVMSRLADSALQSDERTKDRLRLNGAQWVTMATICAAAVWLGWFARTDSNQALAAIQQARRTLSEPADRTYMITVEGRSPRGLTLTRRATLYARGRDHFVLRITGPFGTDILAGSDGTESWLIPPIGPVLVGDDALLIDRWLSRERVPIPLLSLDEILQKLESRYDLSTISDQSRTVHHDNRRPEIADAVRVIGHRRASDTIIPDTVELWTSRRTGVLERLELRWSKTTVRPGPRAINVVLRDEDELAADFFRHTHHAPDVSKQVIDAEPPGSE